MREMKDSGVPWIGDIPTMIRLKKLKYLVSFEKGKLPQETNLEGNGSPYIGASEMNGSAPKVFTTSAIPMCREDDILILWDGANAGLVSTNHKGAVSSTVCRVRKQSGDDSRYLYYCLKNAERYYRDKVSGTTIPHMSTDYLDDTFILGFSLTEQRRIADLLDAKCSELDSVLEMTRASIEEYKKLKQSVITEAVTKGIRGERSMKDSGVEWIGEIPSDWTLFPLKHLFVRRSQKNNPIISTERLSLSIDVGITKYADKTTNLDRFKDDFSQYQLAYPDDIVLNSMNMIVGAVGRSAYFGCVSPVYYVIYPRQTVDVQYWSYLLNCTRIRDVYHSLGQGIYAIERGEGRVNTCRLKVPYDDFERILVPIPSLEEQKEIASYLDDKCKAIDSLIASKDSLICELESYKNSIIYEYVTGKKEVHVQEGGTA